jgi:hypothetical protein
MRREGSRGLSRRSLFPIHPEGFFPSLAPSSYPVLLSAQLYLFISFFFTWIFFFSLVHRSWKRINRNLSKDLSIERSRSLSSSISISKYYRNRSLSPTTMPPGRKERGRHSLSFLLLSTQFSVFVRDHLRRKDRYKFSGGWRIRSNSSLI